MMPLHYKLHGLREKHSGIDPFQIQDQYYGMCYQ